MPEILKLQKHSAQKTSNSAPAKQKQKKKGFSVTEIKNPLTHLDIEAYNERAKQLLDLFTYSYRMVQERHPELSPDQAASIAQMMLINSTRKSF